MKNKLLSELIWKDDTATLKKTLQSIRQETLDLIIDEWDCRGNPPLHLALMLGRVEAAQILIQFGAKSSSINSRNWTALEEAACLGNRDILEKMIPPYWQEDAKELLCSDGPWDKLNKKHPTFYFEILVRLKSPVTIIAQLCPKEVIKIWKTQNSLRVDWTIIRVQGFKIKRGPMSAIFRFHDGKVKSAFIINRDEQIFEELLPNTSKSIIHDVVDSFLKHGIVKEEFHLQEYSWNRATTKMMRQVRNKTKTIKKYKYETDVYVLSNLSCLQRFRSPFIPGVYYSECTDECRSISIEAHMKRCLKFETTKSSKLESLEALQFISESELAADESFLEESVDTKSCDTELAEVTRIFKEGGNVDVKVIDRVNNVLKKHMGKIFGKPGSNIKRSNSSKSSSGFSFSRCNTRESLASSINKIKEPGETNHRRSFSRSSLVGSITSTTRAIFNFNLNSEEEDSGSSHQPLGRVHVKTFHPPDPPETSFEEYFSKNNLTAEGLDVGRDCSHHCSKLSRPLPVEVFMCKDFPVLFSDLIPVMEWCFNKMIPKGDIKQFYDEKIIDGGFPVRIEFPLMGMLAVRATVVKYESTHTLSESDFNLPEGLKAGEILPLFEIE